MDNLYEYKNNIRRLYIKKRNEMSQEEVNKKSKEICNNLFAMSIFQQAVSVMTYVSFKNEVGTHNIIRSLLKNDKEVAVPLCLADSRDLLACRIEKFDDLSPGMLGILEPSPGKFTVMDPERLDVILIPGTAFDRSMNRLGMGAGYYDRFLSKLGSKTVKIGLAYGFQILESIPAEEHDMPMDYIITESGII